MSKISTTHRLIVLELRPSWRDVTSPSLGELKAMIVKLDKRIPDSAVFTHKGHGVWEFEWTTEE